MSGVDCAADLADLIAHAPVDGASESREYRRAWKRYQRQRRAELRAVTVRHQPVAQPAPRQQPRQRARRTTTKRAASSIKSASDGPQRFIVTLPPPDPEAVRRLARLLVDRATTEVLSRLEAQHSDAAEAATPTASRSKVL